MEPSPTDITPAEAHTALEKANTRKAFWEVWSMRATGIVMGAMLGVALGAALGVAAAAAAQVAFWPTVGLFAGMGALTCIPVFADVGGSAKILGAVRTYADKRDDATLAADVEKSLHPQQKPPAKFSDYYNPKVAALTIPLAAGLGALLATSGALPQSITYLGAQPGSTAAIFGATGVFAAVGAMLGMRREKFFAPFLDVSTNALQGKLSLEKAYPGLETTPAHTLPQEQTQDKSAEGGFQARVRAQRQVVQLGQTSSSLH